MRGRCRQISAHIFIFLMATSLYSWHYITAVAIKPVLLQVEYKVLQQKNTIVFLLPLDIKRQYAVSFPSVSLQKYQQQSSSRKVSLLICPCQCCPPNWVFFSQTGFSVLIVLFCMWKIQSAETPFFVSFPFVTPSLISIIAPSKKKKMWSEAYYNYVRHILL